LTTLIGSSLQAQINTKVNLSFVEKVPAWMVENNVPAVGIGIIEDGKIKYIKVFGELKKCVPAPDNTIFNIASMTKPVVAMLTLKLVESGQWNLDEPLAKYWIDPDVAKDPMHKKLTTRHVLTHQTGFPNWRNGKLTFEFEPGTQYQYSGEGFEYLRKALEKKFNRPLANLLDSILFKPLAMKDTRYWDKNTDMLRYAHWHDSNGKEYKTTYETGVSAADLLLTTIEDYCRFSIDVINGAGLSQNIYNDMITPQVKLKEHYGRGLGWEVIKDLPNGEYVLEHSGSDAGVKTIFVLSPKSKRGIVILTNGDNGVFVYNNVIKESLDIGKTLLDYITGSDAHKITTLPNKILERYIGKYLDSYGRNLTITKDDSALKFSGTGLPTVKLFPETENKFFLKDFDVQFNFITDDSLILIANGKIDWTAKKIKDPTIIKLSDDILERYVGTYTRLDNNSNIFVKKEGDSLKLSGETVPSMDLCPIGENRFIAKGLGFQFEFIKDASNKIIKMNVSGNGKILCETKRIN